MQAPRQVLLTVQTFGEIDIFCFSLSGWVASRGGRGGERERSSDDAQYSRRFFFSGLSIIPPPRHKISPTQPKWRRSLGSASVQLCFFSLFTSENGSGWIHYPFYTSFSGDFRQLNNSFSPFTHSHTSRGFAFHLFIEIARGKRKWPLSNETPGI